MGLLASMAPKVKRIMTQPIVRVDDMQLISVVALLQVIGSNPSVCWGLQNLIFRFLQSRQKVQIWLYEQTDLRVEGRIIVSSQPPACPASHTAVAAYYGCL